MKKLFQIGTKLILETIFPAWCVVCEKETGSEWICRTCLSNIKLATDQLCPICEKIKVPRGEICVFCMKKKAGLPPIDRLIVASGFDDKTISRMIHVFKYRFVQDLSRPLGNILTDALIRNNVPIPDLIVPIPLHRRRLRWRGYNQAWLLADHVAKNLSYPIELPVQEVVERKKFTAPQAEIKKFRERSENLAGIFSPCKNMEKSLKGKRILLVDDVSTTGTTLYECARTLKKMGAKGISAAVVARQKI